MDAVARTNPVARRRATAPGGMTTHLIHKGVTVMPRTTKSKKTTTARKDVKPTTNGDTGPSSADKLRTALRRHPDSTARELATYAGIGGSTATKLLAGWASDGQAVRLPGDDTGGPKAAARWAPPEPVTPAPKTSARGKGPARRAKVTTEPGPTTGTDAPRVGRLPKGALHGMCEDFLSEPERRDTAYTAGEIGRKLARSAGAVRNALDKLTERGTVMLTQDEPRRYQIAATD